MEKFGASDCSKYQGQAIRWIDKMDHYELIFTDDFVTPGGSARAADAPIRLGGNAILTDIITDMRAGVKSKEVHVFVGSFGGEVAALNMILQQLLCYQHRVGINLGTACSCGWMLFFACQERYVSPFSQLMYHDMSCMKYGKHSELRSNAEFMGLWQKELLNVTDTCNVLSKKELELGRTSEVWLTGRQLIERNGASDYSEYLTRQIPAPASGMFSIKGIVFGRVKDGYVPCAPENGKPFSYSELVAILNSPEPLEKLLAGKIGKPKGKSKKSTPKAAENASAKSPAPVSGKKSTPKTKK